MLKLVRIKDSRLKLISKKKNCLPKFVRFAEVDHPIEGQQAEVDQHKEGQQAEVDQHEDGRYDKVDRIKKVSLLSWSA